MNKSPPDQRWDKLPAQYSCWDEVPAEYLEKVPLAQRRVWRLRSALQMFEMIRSKYDTTMMCYHHPGRDDFEWLPSAEKGVEITYFKRDVINCWLNTCNLDQYKDDILSGFWKSWQSREISDSDYNLRNDHPLWPGDPDVGRNSFKRCDIFSMRRLVPEGVRTDQLQMRRINQYNTSNMIRFFFDYVDRWKMYHELFTQRTLFDCLEESL